MKQYQIITDPICILFNIRKSKMITQPKITKSVHLKIKFPTQIINIVLKMQSEMNKKFTKTILTQTT